MPFDYTCFISHRTASGELGRLFLDDMYSALSDELELIGGRAVFVDREELVGGRRLDPSFARALCMSACMVVIYTPTYFNLAHPYPTREYLAMLGIEESRFKAAGPSIDQTRGLIVPIVLRGSASVPLEISKHRIFRSFESYVTVSSRLRDHPQFGSEIKAVAEYTHERCTSLEAAGIDLTQCIDFELPTDDAAVEWLNNANVIAPPSPFPLIG